MVTMVLLKGATLCIVENGFIAITNTSCQKFFSRLDFDPIDRERAVLQMSVTSLKKLEPKWRRRKYGATSGGHKSNASKRDMTGYRGTTSNSTHVPERKKNRGVDLEGRDGGGAPTDMGLKTLQDACFSEPASNGEAKRRVSKILFLPCGFEPSNGSSQVWCICITL